MFKDKTFNYFSHSGSIPGAQVTDSSRRRKARIRVDAGDKCVAHAKSRPKKRTSVGGRDTSGLSMDCVQWSDKEYTVTELIRTFSSDFPIIVKVVSVKKHEELDTSILSDQVLQIHSYGKQQRALVTEKLGRRLSIAVDCPIELSITRPPSYIIETKQQVSDTSSLCDALIEATLPLRATVVSMPDALKDASGNLVGNLLNIEKIETETFLRANSINDGWLNALDVHVIPSPLKIKFAAATGMRGATLDEWDDYRQMFARSVRHLNFDLMKGCKGIRLCSGAATYNIDTCDAELTTIVDEDPIYQNIPADADKAGLVYSNIPPRKFVATPDVIVHASQRERAKTPPPISDKPETEDHDVEVMFQEVIEEAEKQDSLRQQKRNLSNREADKHVLSNHESIKDPLSNQEPEKRSLTNQINRYEIIKSEKHVLPNQESETLTSSVRNLACQFECSPQRTTSINPPSNVVVHCTDPALIVDTPKAIVQPRMQVGKVIVSLTPMKESEQPTLPSCRKGSASSLTCMEEVPDEIDNLTVEDVCQCLHLLNMDAHIGDFRTHQIDGGLLSSLRETELTNEFSFTPFNASKLLRFVRGWRPRLS